MAQQDVGDTGGVAATGAPAAASVFSGHTSSPSQHEAAAAQGAAATGQVQQPQRQQHDAAGGAAGAGPLQPQSQQQPQQIQHQQQAWLAAWQQDQATGSSGSGSSLGALLGQVSSGFPASDLPPMDLLSMDPMLATGSWHNESRLTESRGASPLDVLGRPIGHATLPPLPLSRQTSVPVSGAQYATTSEAGAPCRPSSAGVQYSLMSLPASPTMLQHQLQLQLGRASLSASHSISPSTGSWPDVDMEPPLAPQLSQPAAAAAGASAAAAAAPGENGENGDALLWPGGRVTIPTSSSSQLLQQPGVPLGLQLRLPADQQRQLATAAAAAGQQHANAGMLHQQQHQHQQARATSMVQQQHQPHQQQYHSRVAARASDQQQQQLDDQVLMPPPLPVQPGSMAAPRSSTAPRPPPLIIPSSQPQQLGHTQQHLGASSAPTPSPAQPKSGTSITPAMLSMGLADATAAALAGGTAGAASAAVHVEDGGLAATRPRRQRRRASVPSSPALTGGAAASASPPVPTGTAAMLAAGRQYVKVVCGSLQGWLDLTDMMVQVAAGQGHEECKLTPSGFESLAGKGATRKWRQSLTALPDGPTDPWIAEPMPIGDFMKQHMIDKASLPTMQSLHRVSSSSIVDDVSLVSPAAVAAAVRHHALVSPGVRRRRSQHTGAPQQLLLQAAFTGQQLQQDVDAHGADDQPQAHVKRSRGNKGSQQQQQYWQRPVIDAWHAAAVPQDDLQAMIVAVPAAAAASSIMAGGHQGMQFAQQQQAQSADAVMDHMQLPLPLPSMHWRSQSLQQQGAPAAAAGVDAAAAAVAAPVLHLDHEQPAVLSGLVELSQGLSQPSPQQTQGSSQQGSQYSSSQHSSQQGTHVASYEAAAAGADAPAKPLLSPAGRPIRQPAISRHRVAAAAASSRHDRSSQPVGFVGGIRHLQIWCDQLPGMLDLTKMQVFPQEGEFQGQAMSLSAFEQLGGRGTARKWRRSLTTLDGIEAITLGEWMERYQILPGSEGKHISPKRSPKLRATTPPSGAVVTAAQAAAATAAGYGNWQGSRDQQGNRKLADYAALPIHPAAAAMQQQQPQRSSRRKSLQQASPQATTRPLPPTPGGAAAVGRSPAVAGSARHRGSSPVADVLSPSGAAAAAATDVGVALKPGSLHMRRMSRESSGAQVAALPAYAAAVQQQQRAGAALTSTATAADEPVNRELLMMLTEYASEYSHPELHLHPAQVEQDLADLTGGNVGSGLLSPRLGSMDWQPSPSKQPQLGALDASMHQQQQQQNRQPQRQQGVLSPVAGVGRTSSENAAAAEVPFSPASLLGGAELSGQDLMAAFSSQEELEPSQDDTLGSTQ